METVKLEVPENTPMRKTANRPAKIELCEGARFNLYHNIELADKLEKLEK